jgi:DNA-binding winged helix-turn-helix (wHTH) protein
MPQRTEQIGTWRFAPESGELFRGDERVRLEDRAARTLELLCRRRGEVVSQAEIVAKVWGGRQQSPNSVAVVISGLRRTLGDDARNPALIETVTKRGYRLRPAQASRAKPLWRRPTPWLVGGAALASVAAAGLAWTSAPPAKPLVRIEPVVNDTGSAAYRPVAKAVQGLVLTDLESQGRAAVLAPDSQAPGQRPQLVVKSRLILWTGYPAVELSAVDPATGVTIWSGMAEGPEANFPAQVDREMAALGARIAGRPTR